MNTVIVDYNAGNIQSLCYALDRLGVSYLLSHEPDVISAAERVFIPGVGAAASAMENLQERGLDLLIPQLKQPVLGICLGMQLLCGSSEEGNTSCLGIIPQPVLKFPEMPGVKVPHMGWNTVQSCILDTENESWMYFVHSYYVPVCEYTAAQAVHGIPFSAMVRKKNFWGMQFHPEKSGTPGTVLIEKFLQS